MAAPIASFPKAKIKVVIAGAGFGVLTAAAESNFKGREVIVINKTPKWEQRGDISQRSRIEEIFEDAGHLVMFYPKFHCELNWIEYYWGAYKHYARKHCNYTLPGLIEAVPEALESVKPSLIFKYWRRTQRIIQAL
ncbi:hypothetical protein FN846DRAFT_914062 [Sphaerosporella brunnea]|uniref:Tc1-like transposase DDE domain-containing protein n=1 Tax=Sphaerosporella brunnea TaxID=1250544 RepID=A0A5J5EFB6_9PEZI|nr:hypothetical protein FN846DRAFT_914062 [Sphaerosporella brunnea]